MTGSQPAYHLRVNKYIDRQLFTESLGLVDRVKTIQTYGYVSMGGPYLEDCRVIHNALGISRMQSFDSDERIVIRQGVNRPFGFITCTQCASRKAVETFREFRNALGGPETNVVTWLDYTMPNQRKEQLQDLSVLVPELIEWDIVRVTMNAHRNTLGENGVYQTERDKATSEQLARGGFPSSIAAWRHIRLKEQLGDDLPPDRDDASFLTTQDGFFRTIARAIKRTVVRALESRPQLVAVPLLSTGYSDVHAMATATFIIVSAAGEQAFRDECRWKEWPHDPGDEWDDYTLIQVPHLSLRERHIVHAAMARDSAFGDIEPAFMTGDEIDQYKEHYLRYPTFAPLDVI